MLPDNKYSYPSVHALAESFGHLDFKPKPGLPFDDAVLRIGRMNAETFQRHIHTWAEAFPLPEFKTGKPFRYQPMPRRKSQGQADSKYFHYDIAISSVSVLGVRLKSVDELRDDWQKEAKRFFTDIRETLRGQHQQIYYYVDRELMQQQLAYGFPLSINSIDIVGAWINQQQYTVAKLYGEWFSPDGKLTEFVVNYIDQYCTTRRLTPRQLPSQLACTSQPYPKITILKTVQSQLFDALSNYVLQDQHQVLVQLLTDGTPPEIPILCHCEQVCLAAIFYRQVKQFKREDRCIRSNKTDIAKWLCCHFRRVENGQTKALSESTLIKHLSGRELGDYQ